MAKTTSDFLIERLQAWGVNRVYGYPGDGINGIMGALDRADGAIDVVQARHEEMAAFMACAHAKFTGEVGVCMATSGSGRFTSFTASQLQPHITFEQAKNFATSMLHDPSRSAIIRDSMRQLMDTFKA